MYWHLLRIYFEQQWQRQYTRSEQCELISTTVDVRFSDTVPTHQQIYGRPPQMLYSDVLTYDRMLQQALWQKQSAARQVFIQRFEWLRIPLSLPVQNYPQKSTQTCPICPLPITYSWCSRVSSLSKIILDNFECSLAILCHQPELFKNRRLA